MRMRILGLSVLLLAACGNANTGPGPVAATATPSGTPPLAPEATSPREVSAPAAPTPAASTDTSEADTSSARERLMHRHFQDAAQVRSALIRGDLHAAVLSAGRLADMNDLAPIPKAWKPMIQRLQFEAQRIQQSVDVPEAAAAFADIGATCGSCHRTGSGPNPGFGAPPAATGSTATRMQRHAWAMDRLWEGLYAPSDASWKAGADALAGEPFPKAVLDKGGVHTRSAADRFMAIVPSVAGQTTPEGRAKVYASLLAVCSACHVASGVAK